MLRCCYVSGWGLGGVGWDNNVHVTCVHTWCSLLLRQWLGVGWRGIITFMWLACRRDALKCVLTTHKHGRKSILVTDGAPCYPKLTSEHNLIHESCNHSKGIFCIKKKKEMGYLAFAHRCYRWYVEKFQRCRCSIKSLEHTQRWCCEPSVAARNEFRNGDGTMEIAKASSVSPATL